MLLNDMGTPIATGNNVLPTDAQLRLPVPAELSNEMAAFYRKHLGIPVMPPLELISAETRVLVQAWRAGEEGKAYDRVLLNPGERLPLFLPAGAYRLVSHVEKGALVGEVVVNIPD